MQVNGLADACPLEDVYPEPAVARAVMIDDNLAHLLWQLQLLALLLASSTDSGWDVARLKN